MATGNVSASLGLVEMKRASYRITVRREGRWWELRVPDLDVVTQCRRLARAEATARDLIATWLDVDPRSFDVKVRPAVGDDGLDRLISDAVDARAAAERESGRARTLTDEVVHHLVARGVPMRDIGELLGISHQRVAQLAGR